MSCFQKLLPLTTSNINFSAASFGYKQRVPGEGYVIVASGEKLTNGGANAGVGGRSIDKLPNFRVVIKTTKILTTSQIVRHFFGQFYQHL